MVSLKLDLAKETNLDNYLTTLLTSLNADIKNTTLPSNVVSAYKKVISTVQAYQPKVKALVSEYQSAIKDLTTLTNVNKTLETQANAIAQGYKALSLLVNKINALSPSSSTYDNDFQSEYSTYSKEVTALNAEINKFNAMFKNTTTAENNFNTDQSNIQQHENLNINGKLGLVDDLNNLSKALQAANAPTIPFDTAVTQNSIDLTNNAIKHNEARQTQMSQEAKNAAAQAKQEGGPTIA